MWQCFQQLCTTFPAHCRSELQTREGDVVTRDPRILKCYGNPQIVDGRLEVQVG